MAYFTQTSLHAGVAKATRQVAARAHDDRRNQLAQRGFAAALASFLVAQPVMAETWQEALSHYPDNPPEIPYLDRFHEGDRAPDAVLFFTGRKMDPPKISGNITMDELRPLIKGKKIYQVVFNEACTQVLVEYKNSDEKKLMTGLTGIDDEVIQEIMDQRPIHRIVSVVPDFTKPIPIEATIPPIKWEDDSLPDAFTYDLPKSLFVD